MKREVSRAASFAAVIVLYAVALAAALLTGRLLKGAGPLFTIFLSDVAATLVVWLFGVALRNSSVYDPYWSVAPAAIAALHALCLPRMNLVCVAFIAILFIWSARLTANWAVRWRGLAHEDWRYIQYKRRMPRLWFWVNLFGINLMPTVLVFLALIPACMGMGAGAQAGWLTAAGAAVCAAAIGLEFVADRQMDAYRKAPGPKSPTIDTGLWRMCRHPNYLGEILFWWGIWLMGMSAVPAPWTVIGPALITVLFVFISIPMMEKHILESRPEYAQYMREVPGLVPAVFRRASAPPAPPQAQ